MSVYLKKFATREEHDAYLSNTYPNPNVSYVEDENIVTYNIALFPLYITTWKDDKQDVHGEATILNKKLYDYYMTNCELDPLGAMGETILYLSDDQELYINNIKVQYLYQAFDNLLRGTVAWYPNDIWSTPSNHYYGDGGLRSDGSIYEKWEF